MLRPCTYRPQTADAERARAHAPAQAVYISTPSGCGLAVCSAQHELRGPFRTRNQDVLSFMLLRLLKFSVDDVSVWAAAPSPGTPQVAWQQGST